MNLFPKEYYYASYIFTMFWIGLLLGIILFGRKSVRINSFKNRMLQNWKPSLVMASITYLTYIVGRLDTFGISDIRNFINPFCQFMIGITIVKSMGNLEAFPTIKAIVLKKGIARKIIGLIIFSLLLSLLILVSNSITSIGMGNNSELAEHVLSLKSKWQLFFTFLSGAGILEETVFRLIILSIMLKLTRKSWLAIAISALIFGIYHLTPLNAMYMVNWEYPIRKMISVSIAGIIFGIFYIRKGFGTTVLGHTLSNWIPFLLING